ncbi:MAG: 50S ribosomal protein L23 [Desulfobulbaceae bacterium]|nr:50S ribosomal protein L23 [Desulfobulbaceae bacterium]MCK5544218.1 50S ribosomal protein L23 [Desulfobulbaceae bacterium]
MNDVFSVIKKPCLTEKGSILQEDHNQIVIKVDPRANKIEIKDALEKLFNVKVAKVRTANMHGKKKRVGKHIGYTSNWKKAVVTLEEGHKIDFRENL